MIHSRDCERGNRQSGLIAGRLNNSRTDNDEKDGETEHVLPLQITISVLLLHA